MMGKKLGREDSAKRARLMCMRAQYLRAATICGDALLWIEQAESGLSEFNILPRGRLEIEEATAVAVEMAHLMDEHVRGLEEASG